MPELSPRFAPDGKSIAFWHLGAPEGVYVLTMGRGAPHLVLPVGDDKDAAFAWSPGGQRLAASISCRYERATPCKGAPTALYILGRDGTRRRAVVVIPRVAGQDPRIRDIAWSRDGRRIAYVVNDAFLYTVAARGGKPHLLAAERGGDYALGAAAWSPNGHWIAYGGHCFEALHGGDIDCDLTVRPSSGGRPRVLLRAVGRDTGLSAPAWTPDSRTVLYSQHTGGQGTLFATDLATASPRVVLHGFANVIAVARDGRLVFVDELSPVPTLASLSGQVLDRAPRIPFYAEAGGAPSVWVR